MTIDIEELRELESEMTPGPWDVIYRCGLEGGDGSYLLRPGYIDNGVFDKKEDAFAVAAFRNAMPGLLDELERLRAIVDKLPVTADGVRFVPDKKPPVYRIQDGRAIASHEVCNINGQWFAFFDADADGDWSFPVDFCYSTEAAALAAMEAK